MGRDPLRRVAINTGGGDAPGLNAVIHSVVCASERAGLEVFGIRDGYDGLLEPQKYPAGGLRRLRYADVRHIAHLGGTILGTTNRGNPFASVRVQPDGSRVEVDRSDELLESFRRHQLDALIATGGDGSLTIAQGLVDKGLRVIGVPKTIDNDLESTVLTFGYDTAVSFATECIDRLHSTAASHRRVIVVEVMGRYAGWIAVSSGIAGRAHAILIPEIPYDIARVADHLRKRAAEGDEAYAIVVVAEGAKPITGEAKVRSRELGRAERLGGIGEAVAGQLQELTGLESRAVVLGHLLRGGSPTAIDRMLGLTFGAAAVRGLTEGRSGVMVALNPPHVTYVPIRQAVARMKLVPPDGNHVTTARALGITFGDAG
jgi:ATP-dependent phosphofructokinase / diphosphate-dependent phosphofructokinase